MKKILPIIVLFFTFHSCKTDNCSENLGFRLDYHLFDKVEVEGESYCELVNSSLKGDEIAITNLSKVKVGDFASYQHGAVLIEVIDKIGESKYVQIISQLPNNEQKLIYFSFIWAGLEFTPNAKYKNRRIEIVFPKLTKKLNNEKPE